RAAAEYARAVRNGLAQFQSDGFDRDEFMAWVEEMGNDLAGSDGVLDDSGRVPESSLGWWRQVHRSTGDAARYALENGLKSDPVFITFLEHVENGFGISALDGGGRPTGELSVDDSGFHTWRGTVSLEEAGADAQWRPGDELTGYNTEILEEGVYQYSREPGVTSQLPEQFALQEDGSSVPTASSDSDPDSRATRQGDDSGSVWSDAGASDADSVYGDSISVISSEGGNPDTLPDDIPAPGFPQPEFTDSLEEPVAALVEETLGGISSVDFHTQYDALSQLQQGEVISRLLESHGADPENQDLKSTLADIQVEVVKFVSGGRVSESARFTAEVLLEQLRRTRISEGADVSGNVYEHMRLDPWQAELALETSRRNKAVQMTVDEDGNRVLSTSSDYYSTQVVALNDRPSFGEGSVPGISEALLDEIRPLTWDWWQAARGGSSSANVEVYDWVFKSFGHGNRTGIDSSMPAYAAITRDPDGKIAAIGIYSERFDGTIQNDYTVTRAALAESPRPAGTYWVGAGADNQLVSLRDIHTRFPDRAITALVTNSHSWKTDIGLYFEGQGGAPLFADSPVVDFPQARQLLVERKIAVLKQAADELSGQLEGDEDSPESWEDTVADHQTTLDDLQARVDAGIDQRSALEMETRLENIRGDLARVSHAAGLDSQGEYTGGTDGTISELLGFQDATTAPEGVELPDGSAYQEYIDDLVAEVVSGEAGLAQIDHFLEAYEDVIDLRDAVAEGLGKAHLDNPGIDRLTNILDAVDPSWRPRTLPTPPEEPEHAKLEQALPTLDQELKGQVEDLVTDVVVNGLDTASFNQRYGAFTEDQKSILVSRLLENLGLDPTNAHLTEILSGLEDRILTQYKDHNLSSSAELVVETLLERVRRSGAGQTTVSDSHEGELYLDPVRAGLLMDSPPEVRANYWQTQDGQSTAVDGDGSYRTRVFALIPEGETDPHGASTPTENQRTRFEDVIFKWSGVASHSGADVATVGIYNKLMEYVQDAYEEGNVANPDHLVVVEAPNREIAAFGTYTRNGETGEVNIDFIAANPALLYAERPEGILWRGAGRAAILAASRDIAQRFPDAVITITPQNPRVETTSRDFYFGENRTPQLFTGESGQPLGDYTDAQTALLERQQGALNRAVNELRQFVDETDSLVGTWRNRLEELNAELTQLSVNLDIEDEPETVRNLGETFQEMQRRFALIAEQAKSANPEEFEEGLTTATLDLARRHYSLPDDATGVFRDLTADLPEDFPYKGFFESAPGTPDQFASLLNMLIQTLGPEETASRLKPRMQEAVSGLISREVSVWIADSLLNIGAQQPDAVDAFFDHIGTELSEDFANEISGPLGDEFRSISSHSLDSGGPLSGDLPDGLRVEGQGNGRVTAPNDELVAQGNALVEELDDGTLSLEEFQEAYAGFDKGYQYTMISRLLEIYNNNPEAHAEVFDFLKGAEADVRSAYFSELLSERATAVVNHQLEAVRWSDKGIAEYYEAGDPIFLDRLRGSRLLATAPDTGTVEEWYRDPETGDVYTRSSDQPYNTQVYELQGDAYVRTTAIDTGRLPQGNAENFQDWSGREDALETARNWLETARENNLPDYLVGDYQTIVTAMEDGHLGGASATEHRPTYLTITRNPVTGESFLSSEAFCPLVAVWAMADANNVWANVQERCQTSLSN
ncbi:MAG: hypothetical protein MI747_05595, partial [Desulfobacterales bacterium]|nr:hypothetical protein [Desulfobacterales bacterium]